MPVPSRVLATFGGERLGFAGATAAIFAGLCLGNVVGYLIGRLAASPLVERLVGPEQLAWAQAKVGTRPGAVALLVTRPIPILSEAAVVLTGGASGGVAAVLVPVQRRPGDRVRRAGERRPRQPRPTPRVGRRRRRAARRRRSGGGARRPPPARTTVR